MEKQLVELLIKLTGYLPPISSKIPEKALTYLENGQGLGYTQLNELLLHLGYDRINYSFFQYLVNGETVKEKANFNLDSKIESIDTFRLGIDRFRIFALRVFGNVKHAFSQFSENIDEFNRLVDQFQPNDLEDFRKRKDTINTPYPIDGELTFLMGYISNTNGISDRLLNKKLDVRELGKRNHIAYLTSDFMDVYVATSMREPIHFLNINNSLKPIFERPELTELNLRFFDPTQAFCEERVDKGLSEALMLKRAKCTLYFAQESETLGKDSELASTLAQGKAVVAYVPVGDEKYVKRLISEAQQIFELKSPQQVLIDLLMLYKPNLAWENNMVKAWLTDLESVEPEEIEKLLHVVVKEALDKKANTLQNNHPLGFQVHLETGVANGVLVVRNEEDCAKLLRSIILDNMEFELISKMIPIEKKEGEIQKEYLFLREKISQSFFRVMTGDDLLTNVFWDFYLYEN